MGQVAQRLAARVGATETPASASRSFTGDPASVQLQLGRLEKEGNIQAEITLIQMQ